MTREALEELAAPIVPRFKSVLEQAITRSGVAVTDISSVEVVGSATRTPVLQRIVEEVFQKVCAGGVVRVSEC